MIQDLQDELALLGMTNLEREKAIALRQANADAASIEGIAISAAIDNLDKARVAAEGMDVLNRSTTNLFSDLMSGAKSAKEAFGDFIDSILQGISNLVAQQLTQSLFSIGSTNGSGGFGGFLMNFIGGLFGGGRAIGGGVNKGMFYEVNEKGPELLSIAGKDFLMMGNQSGTITPNHMLAGKSGGNTNNITINVPPTTERRTAQQIAQRSQEKLRTATTRNT